MVKTVLVVVLLTTFLREAPAQAIDWGKVHSLTVQGIDQLYNLEMDRAAKTFDEVIHIAPRDPRGYFFKGMIHFWNYTLNKDEREYRRFFGLADTVIEICERELDRNSNKVTSMFYLGGIHGYRGLAHHRNGSYLNAAVDGRKGYMLLRDATRLKPDLYDAQMGFGLFSYLIGKLPKSYRWLLNVIGFEGDVEGGLRLLQSAAERGTYTRSEATFYLSQFLNMENRHDEARTYIQELIAKYPRNPLFLVTFAQWELRHDRVETAMDAAQKAMKINAELHIRFGDEFAHSVLAGCYFIRNDFPNARDHAELYLQKTENRENVPNSIYYRLGVCYEALGQRDKAVAMYRQMKSVDPDAEAWNYRHYRKGQARLERPLSAIDLALIKAENAASIREYNTAEQLYGEVLAHSPDEDQRALALYGLAQVRAEQNRDIEAVETARQLVALRPARETWVIPHGYYALGHSLAKLGMNKEAREAMKKVDDYGGYEFQSRLESRVERELQKLDGKN